jgi:hypothetical protein
VKYGSKGERVRQAQQQLKRLAVHLPNPDLDPGPVDGILGPKTRGALNAFAASIPMALEKAAGSCSSDKPAALPPVFAWFDRSGILSPERCIRLGAGLLDRAKLFTQGLEHKPFQMLRGASEVSAVVAEYRAHGIDCDLTVWSRQPRRAEDRARLGAYVDLCAQLGVRADLDREHVIRGERDADRRVLVDAFRGSGVTVCLNDYAYVQRATVKLARELSAAGVRVVLSPQAYSVDFVRYLPPAKQQIRPGSVYWPGATQMAAMRPNAWGQLYSQGVYGLDFGLAAYKQRWANRPMDADRSIRAQVKAAMLHNPSSIGFWHGESLTGQVRLTLEALKRGQ